MTVPTLVSSAMKRGVEWRPTEPGAKPAATAKVERRVSAAIFMVDMLRYYIEICVSEWVGCVDDVMSVGEKVRG